MEVLTVFRSLGNTVSQVNPARVPQGLICDCLTTHLLPSCPSLTLSLTQPCLGAPIHLEFSHEEIMLGSSCFLPCPTGLRLRNLQMKVLLQNDKTRYKHAHKPAGSPPLPGVHRDESHLWGWCRQQLLPSCIS